MVVLHAKRSKSGLKCPLNHRDMAIVGDFRPAIIGRDGVLGLCAFDSRSHETIEISSTSASCEQQEGQISTSSSSLSPRLLSPLSNCSSSLNKSEENISSTLSESSALLSPSIKRRQEQTSVSSSKSPRLSSPSSRVSRLLPSSPSKQVISSSFECSSTSNTPTPNPSDLSGSFNEPPVQPKLANYPMNKDKSLFCLPYLAGSSNRGNFIELLEWTSGTDPVASSVLNDSAKNSTYLSPGIQNDLIALIASNIRQQITEKVRGSVFSLMVDESRDISGNQQLSVVVRVIDLEITANNNQTYRSSLFKEYFLGFI
ncbi:unnamed protein product [Rotaria sp. Silwood1]|nr:unnamed protein product [Rotaria sp. Silwood1]